MGERNRGVPHGGDKKEIWRMTKTEVDVAGTLGIPVVRTDQDVPMESRHRYRVLSVMKRYPEQYERERGKKARSLVEIIDVDPMSRSSCILPMDNIVPADPVGFSAILEAYSEQKVLEKNPEKEPKNHDTGDDRVKKKRKEPFEKPDIAEVAAYAAENELRLDPQAFMDHYDACGWVVGKNKPMRDWRAAVRNWVRRNGEFGGVGGENAGKESSFDVSKPSSFDTDAFFSQALKNSYGEDLS